MPQIPVTSKPIPNTLELRISCLLQPSIKLMSKEGFLQKKSSSFFKGWKVSKKKKILH